MENEIKKGKEVVSPKGLKPKKSHEVRAPKPMKEKERKEKEIQKRKWKKKKTKQNQRKRAKSGSLETAKRSPRHIAQLRQD